MLKQAESVLGYDLLQLCVEGPKEKLDDTVYSQPALYVAGLAAVEKLRQDNPMAVTRCTATAGQPHCVCRLSIFFTEAVIVWLTETAVAAKNVGAPAEQV